MIALPSRVPDYTTNFTTHEVATVPELRWWSGMSRRQWRRMTEVVIPKVMALFELGRWSWSIMPKLGVRQGL